MGTKRKMRTTIEAISRGNATVLAGAHMITMQDTGADDATTMARSMSAMDAAGKMMDVVAS